jgi:hypothetical protein
MREPMPFLSKTVQEFILQTILCIVYRLFLVTELWHHHFSDLNPDMLKNKVYSNNPRTKDDMKVSFQN